jgi:hypothetical protein
MKNWRTSFQFYKFEEGEKNSPMVVISAFLCDMTTLITKTITRIK